MIDNIYLLIILFFLTSIQSIAGVGILILGTPILLFLGKNMIEVMAVLLPVSIMTSLITLLISNKKGNLNNKFPINFQMKKDFFLICIPSIFIGLIILNFLNHKFNFELIVSSIILISIFLKNLHQKNNFKIKTNLKKFLFFLIGILHGITNSGGTILSLFLLSLNSDKKEISRYQIIFFYLFLAAIQYLIFLILFNFTFNNNIMIITFLSLSGILLGLIIKEKINDTFFSFFIQVLSFISAILLIMKATKIL